MGKNILIADDSAFMRMILKGILTKDGYNVVGEATNGKEAIGKYTDIKPDLAIIDTTMPYVNGLQALKQIMAIDPSAKVIMCSEMGQKDTVIEAIQAGAKDFIVKPFQADKVKKTIKKFL